MGSGTETWFWRANWLDGCSIKTLAPDLFVAVDKKAIRVRTVAQGMQGEHLVADITDSLSTLGLHQYIVLWERLQAINLDVTAADRFLRKWTSSNQYTTSLAYRAFFIGQSSILGAKELHKARAPPVSKIFIWLPCWDVVGRLSGCITTTCPTTACARFAPRLMKHSLICCLLVSSAVRSSFGAFGYAASSTCSRVWKRTSTLGGSGFNSLVILVWWQIWKERNARIFDPGHTLRQPAQLLQSIRDEGRQWVAVGY
jgi:hypothetical protein